MTTATGPARRMRAPARRAQLIDVTARLAVEEGFHAVSVEAIAQRAGVTRAVIYQHFPDLHALLESVIDREMTLAQAQVAHTTPTDLGTGQAKELLLHNLAAFLTAVRENPMTWRLVLLPPEGAPALLRERIQHGRSMVLGQLTRAVRRGLRVEEFGDAELTAHLLSAIADEYARLVLTDPERYPPDRLLQHADRWLDRDAFGL
ncbi:TetR/AcrR family transcriptional regulator [Blastococcus goldschmidtiae]|uniref:TetR/AcrR family transcriptional regulator n=1 Tax=Blastococcus goldschmidtiae TaxID=3075546 RepID=A0ABU2KCW5_9ACTN|nr:TetR/AcrR family transcriptional regulator [Blastococcus sp. DSM 46792]MDT0278008.1 TetR/AcrR family transcriptional regulator [Blastococcus sp. DSM 46792]